MRSNAREIEHLESSIRSLEKENFELKKEIESSELDKHSKNIGQVEELKEKISNLESQNLNLREEEKRLVQEMKQYKNNNFKSFIGVSHFL